MPEARLRRTRANYGTFKKCCFCDVGFWTTVPHVNACETCCASLETPGGFMQRLTNIIDAQSRREDEERTQRDQQQDQRGKVLAIRRDAFELSMALTDVPMLIQGVGYFFVPMDEQ